MEIRAEAREGLLGSASSTTSGLQGGSGGEQDEVHGCGTTVA